MEKDNKNNKQKENKKVIAKEENKNVNKESKEIKEKEKNIDLQNAKNKKEKKSKRWIVIVILLLILIALVLLVVYISITPRMSVNNALNNLKNGNSKLANLNIEYKELIAVLDGNIIKENQKEMSELEKNCFNSLSWSITGEAVTNKEATVDVEITTKNFRQVLLNWIEKISETLEVNGDISNEENISLLAESIKQDNVENITNIATLNLERKGLTWKIKVDDNLINAIYPGLNQVLDVMEQLSRKIDKEEIEK